MEKIKAKQTPSSLQEDLISHFQLYVSKNMPLKKGSKIKLYDAHRLDYSKTDSLAQSYLLKLIISNMDDSPQFKRIVLKRLHQDFPILGYSSLKSKNFSDIQSVQIPEIIHIDTGLGYVLTEFLSGKEITYLFDQIFDQGHIKPWQKKIFERIGEGLAEIHLKLKIIHSDSRLVNWIYAPETGEISLIDWEWAGQGDPAWDLSRLIYSAARRASRLKYNSSFEKSEEIYDIFNGICSSIIDGYIILSENEEIIKKTASYWMHHSFSVTAEIHEIIFRCCGFAKPKEFIFLKKIPDPIISKMINEDSTFIKKIFRISTKLGSLILLVSSKRKAEDVSHTFRRLKQMFAREIKHMS